MKSEFITGLQNYSILCTYSGGYTHCLNPLNTYEYLMQQENSWRVQLDEKGNVIWVSGDKILTRQPA